jgi:hypothetical protein
MTYNFTYSNKYFEYDGWANITQKVNDDNNLKIKGVTII